MTVSIGSSQNDIWNLLNRSGGTVDILEAMDTGIITFLALVCRHIGMSTAVKNSPFSEASNKSYGEWREIFHDHVIVAAILDRILHNCTTINIKDKSYRLKERRKHGLITTQK